MQSLALVVGALFLFTSCGLGSKSSLPTRASTYPGMYSRQPRSIVVMPPINETNHVDAKEYFYTTLFQPLVERGYYVVSPVLAKELMEQEGAENAEEFLGKSLKPFQTVFGVDAVLFTKILRWERDALSNYVRAQIEYILRDASTGAELFRRSADIKVDTKAAKGFGWLDNVVNAIATVATNKTVAARKANEYILRDLPVGPYDGQHGKDGEVLVGPKDVKGETVR